MNQTVLQKVDPEVDARLAFVTLAPATPAGTYVLSTLSSHGTPVLLIYAEKRFLMAETTCELSNTNIPFSD